MIIDTHTHWGIVWEDKYGSNPTEWLKVLDKHNIEMAALYGHRGLMRNSDIKRSNDIVKEVSVRSDGRLIPIATVHPDFGDESVEELERCFAELDMRGLKLHPWLQGCSTSGTVMDELVGICGKYDVPVIFHDGTPVYSLSCQVGGLALRFPDTTFVLGHSGLIEYWRSAISFLNRCENLYCILCGPHLAGIKGIINSVDENKIMWGSDFGFGNADLINYRLHLLDNVDMDDGKRDKIMGLNAKRLFRI